MKRDRFHHPGEQEGPLAEVNMTPLIDVSLVLVIILLLATPLAFEASLVLRDTRTINEPAGAEGIATAVVIEILSDTTVKVNGRVVDVGELPEIIGPVLAAADNRDVAVSCAGQVSHGTFVQVLDITKLSGATGIAVARN